MKQDLINLIVELAREIQAQERPDWEEEIGAATRLFGKSGLLDSRGLVSLVIAVEQEIEDRFDKTVELADEKALSRESSPYRTIETLADYAVSQMETG